MDINKRRRLNREMRDTVAVNVTTILQANAGGWFKEIRCRDNLIEIDVFEENGKDTTVYNLVVTKKK